VENDNEYDFVPKIRFADANDGWVIEDGLWETHDGGSHWHVAPLVGLASGFTVMDVEAAGGFVQAAAFDNSSDSAIHLESSAVTKDAWTKAQTSVQLGAGAVPRAQIVLHGSSGGMIEVDRTVVGGARLQSGSWVSWTPPCSTTLGPSTLAVYDATHLIAVHRVCCPTSSTV
jgi:hypothetical protein